MNRNAIFVRAAALLLSLALPAGAWAQEAAATQAPAAAAAKALYSKKGADTCIDCHDEARILSIFRTPHAQRTDDRTPFGHGKLQCESCHGPGAAHSARVRSGQERPPINNFGDDAVAPVAVQNSACLDCHKTDMKHGWTGSAHERSGLTCAGCHDSHESRDSVLVMARQSAVCYSCHKQQQAQAQLPFSHPLQEGKMACSSCHNAHGTTADASLQKTSLNQTCYSCHADKRGPFLWEHAPATEDCSTCHRAHGSTQPAMLTQRSPLLCQQCHSQAGHPALPVTAGGLPGATPSNYLLGGGCLNCHSQVHGSNHPSGAKLAR
jgi:DmsE family decaheme c-type cytochrome